MTIAFLIHTRYSLDPEQLNQQRFNCAAQMRETRYLNYSLRLSMSREQGEAVRAFLLKFPIRSLNAVQLSPLNSSKLDNVVDIVTEKDRIRERILRAG